MFYNSAMKKISAETFIEVPFYDLDPMNVVWHENYIKYLEVSRCDLLSKIGYTYDDMKSDGFAYPVATMDLKFIKPSTFAQKLKIVTEILDVEPALNIKYEIFDAETNEKIFKAKSMQICVDIKTRESAYAAPERFIEKLREYEV